MVLKDMLGGLSAGALKARAGMDPDLIIFFLAGRESEGFH